MTVESLINKSVRMCIHILPLVLLPILQKSWRKKEKLKKMFLLFSIVCVWGGGGEVHVWVLNNVICAFSYFLLLFGQYSPHHQFLCRHFYIYIFFHPVMSLSVQCIRNVLIVIMLQCTYSSFLSLPLTHARTVCCGKLTQPEWNIIKSTPNLPERQHTNLRYIKCNT